MPTRVAGFVVDSSGNPVSGATVTPRASDGSVGTTAVTNTAGFVAIGGLTDKIWTGTAGSNRFQHAVETLASDDIHNQSNTLSAHDFNQLRGKATVNQITAGSTSFGKVIASDGAGNAVWTNLADTFGVPVAQGDLLYGVATFTIGLLPKDTNATRYLSNQGTANNPSWNQVNLVNGVTGALPIANAGTNITTYTAGDILYASAANVLSKLAVGANPDGYVLTLASGLPSWAAATGGSSYTDEQAQDAIGAMIDSSLVYVDATPLLTRAALTGDVTAPQGSNATTLATVNANVGSFGSASQVGTFTVNGKGLLTAAANVSIAIAASAITSGTLGVTRGGTGLATISKGSIIYASATDTLSTVRNTVASARFLQQTGDGTDGLAPIWFDLLGTGNTWSASQTFSNGASVNGTTLFASGINLRFGTSNQRILGTSPTLDIISDAASSVLNISSTGTAGVLNTDATAATNFKTAGTTRLSLNTTGATVTGTLTVGSLGGYIFGTAGVFSAVTTIPVTDLTGTLGVSRGGTGLSSLSKGDMLYASAANTLSTIRNTTTTAKFLQQTGDATDGLAPVWFDLFGTANTWAASQTISSTNRLYVNNSTLSLYGSGATTLTLDNTQTADDTAATINVLATGGVNDSTGGAATIQLTATSTGSAIATVSMKSVGSATAEWRLVHSGSASLYVGGTLTSYINSAALYLSQNNIATGAAFYSKSNSEWYIYTTGTSNPTIKINPRFTSGVEFIFSSASTTSGSMYMYPTCTSLGMGVNTTSTCTITIQNQDSGVLTLNLGNSTGTSNLFGTTVNVVGSAEWSFTNTALTCGSANNIILGTSGQLQLRNSNSYLSSPSDNQLDITMGGSVAVHITTALFELKSGWDLKLAGNIKDANGNTILDLIETASADDYITIQNHTSSPILATAGADTNIDLTITPKGSGKVIHSGIAQFNSSLADANGNTILDLIEVASAVNYFTISNSAAAGAAPKLAVTGSDTDVGITLETKGAGDFTFQRSGGTNVFLIDVASSSANYLSVSAPATGGAIVEQAAGSDSVIPLHLKSKGAAGVELHANSESLVRAGTTTSYFQVLTTPSGSSYARIGGALKVVPGDVNLPNNNTGLQDFSGMSFSIPASTLSANGDCIVFEAAFTFVSGVPSKIIGVNFAGTNVYTSATVTSVSGTVFLYGRIIRLSNTTATVVIDAVSGVTGISSAATLTDISGVNFTTTAYTLKLQGQSDGVGEAVTDVKARLFVVEWNGVA